jgi:hypothetical protein
MPQQTLNVSLPNALPTQPFQTANSAVLFGIRLTDASGNANPLGPWPSDRTQVGCTMGTGAAEPCVTSVGGSLANKNCWTSTNCAYRTDDDGDGITGITSLVVPPGGVSTDSPLTFAATSVDCPRSTTGARQSYAYYPGLEGGIVGTSRAIKKFYTASRTISRYDGTITSCDRMEGSVKGPKSSNTQVQADFRFYGCADDSPDSVCGSSVLDDGTVGIDRQSQTTTSIPSASFVMVRVSNATTCDQVRAMTF